MMKKFIFSIDFHFDSYFQPLKYIHKNTLIPILSLTVSMNSDSNFVYRDSEGYSIVIGLIENNDPLSFLTNVVIQANFYDDFNLKSIRSKRR